MTDRYQIIKLANSLARVVDTVTQELVHTQSGNVYEAPFDNAQWTADMLNKRDQKSSAPAPKSDKPYRREELHVGDSVMDRPTGRLYRVIEIESDSLAHGARVDENGRLSDTDWADIRLIDGMLSGTFLRTSLAVPEHVKARHPEAFPAYAYGKGLNTPKPQSDLALAWTVGAYTNATVNAADKVRRVLRMLGSDAIAPEIRVLLESALGSLESAKETAEQNPYV